MLTARGLAVGHAQPLSVEPLFRDGGIVRRILEELRPCLAGRPSMPRDELRRVHAIVVRGVDGIRRH